MSAIVEKLGTAWAFRLIGLVTLVTGFPAAWFIRERTPAKASMFVEWLANSSVLQTEYSVLMIGNYFGIPNLQSYS